MKPAPTERENPRELPRVLSTAHATSIVVGIIIGSGIFLVPHAMAAATGDPRVVYFVWLAGGVLSLFGATTYAEIAAARPFYGGEYAFLKDAYGDVWAFLFMWTLTAVGKPASLATIAAGLMLVLEDFSPLRPLAAPAFHQLIWAQFAAVIFTWAITALNICGTRRSVNTQMALTWLKSLLIVAIAAACFFGGRHGSWRNFEPGFHAAHAGLGGAMTALVAALWAYNGWNDVSHMAGEIGNPKRSLPFALIAGVSIVAGLYMLMNAAVQYVLPFADIAHTARPAADAMRLAVGSCGALIVSAIMAVSIVSTFLGSSLSGARIPFAAAHDGLFFKTFAYVHPRFQTPVTALVLQSFVTSVLLLTVRDFQALFSLAIFSQWLAYGLATSTIFVFRRRPQEKQRSYSAFLYPVSPICFIAAAIGLSLFSIVSKPRSSALAVFVIACGLPLYFMFMHQQRMRNR